MDKVLFDIHLESVGPFGPLVFVLTGWKLVGFLGAFLFTGRWFVQMWASKVKKRPVMPRAFWYMSILGSSCLLSYFIFGKNDSVGIISNLFPVTVAFYNLILDFKHRRVSSQPTSQPSS